MTHPYDPDEQTPDPTPEPDRADRDEAQDAKVVPLTARRSRLEATVEGDDETDEFDRETVTADAPSAGPPVDPPDDTGPMPAGRTGQARDPVVPAWLRSRASIRATAAHQAKDASYVAGYHAMRSPKYIGKTLVYAPVGFAATTGRLITWTTAERGNWELRQAAATRNDPKTWLELDKRRQRESRWRWQLVTALSVVGLVASVAFVATGAAAEVPAAAYLAAAAALVMLFARLGRPADAPITDRVSEGPRYRKLTAELVRRALVSTGVPAINQAVGKDPNAITFPQEIHRDGPGHLAVVDLPFGVEAADVVARRGRLASAMRLPFDQVWPEPGEGHPGRLALWVGYMPASQMKQPTWPLLRDGKVDVFKPFPFATTPRMETVNAEIMARNWLIGGQPGSGKTFAVRNIVLAAALDPSAELRGYELKGVGDFACVEPVCTEYGNGFDDETIGRAAALITWLYAECGRRAQRIAHYHKRGKAPENKVTPELARLKGSGLHPLVVFIDEVQELFQHPSFGKSAGETCEKVIKLGRALGVIILLGTQIPDKDSLPTGITRNVNTRMCLSVADQTANDMILGTSAYKQGNRATVFEPVTDAGWGILSGIGKAGARRSFFLDTEQADKVVARAIDYRTKAGTMPDRTDHDPAGTPEVDLLGDLADVWPGQDEAAWNEELCTRLADKRPEIYGGWKSERLTAALKPHGVTVASIGRRVDGKATTRRGIRLDDLTAALTQRSHQSGS